MRRIGSLLEASDVEHSGRLFFEEPFLVVFGREMLQEPVGEFRGAPAEQMQGRTLLHVLSHAMPGQRRLAAHVQSDDLAFEQQERRLELQRFAWPAENAARETSEP